MDDILWISSGRLAVHNPNRGTGYWDLIERHQKFYHWPIKWMLWDAHILTMSLIWPLMTFLVAEENPRHKMKR